jgi:hypothetical protein
MWKQDIMKETEVTEYARSLLNAHGDKAEAEAAHKEQEARDGDDEKGADNWHRIRLAIHEMRS